MSASHAVWALRLHIVFVTKYRRKTLTPEILDALQEAFAEILADWRCTLVECGGEADHVHRLIGIHPALNIAPVINHLKSARSRRMRNRFADP
ncbi:IS200/IS605 family transposase [Sulfobacillus thermosulfidooxidans]|uniref:IS200/IS605 family transposase n=1 Tax=Sulfobacillus thermosulfidooxidans TaxID=28034 RepID=UPI00241CEE0F|nr:IS200/IS605 family transposase [Sulfobacillus thermosulfidooxidans]